MEFLRRFSDILGSRRAKSKADEYDAAQERGEVVGAHDGARKRVEDSNAIATTADLGLRRDEIHEARQIRDAERAELPIKLTAPIG